MIPSVLSIDIGSVAVTSVLLDQDGTPVKHSYVFHKGRIADTLQDIITSYDLNSVDAIVSPSANPLFTRQVITYDTQLSIIAAAKYFYPDIASILLVGAGRFQLIRLDAEGKFIDTISNTSCAAGTGSFLDQQAGRLNLKDVQELCFIADQNTDPLPDIASRCAVFAKTDLIHAQQAGYSLKSICDSLCRGLAKNIVDTLCKDQEIKGPVLFTGGVSKNSAVKRHLEDMMQASLSVHKYSHLFGAIGAALIFQKEKSQQKQSDKEFSIHDIIKEKELVKEYYFPPLSLQLSEYPTFDSAKAYSFSSHHVKHNHDIQVDVYGNILENTKIQCYLGFDIGSTSTKAVITDTEGNPLAGFYTYTKGQPLIATQAILESVNSLAGDLASEFDFRGVGTTGSGRKFIGKVIGADRIVDEITTHARAAYELDPDIDTIIEIGGQDSKFTLLRNGRVTFAQMNSVCAAGTGSFIEEQAKRLGVELSDYSDLAEGAEAPLASDRCTVFMERDINHYLNNNYTVNEILASVLHSVRENYLKKVAVEPAIGNKVTFQGATAKNKALVAAFEEKLGKELYVSKYCHLTGALGTALLLKDESVEESVFKGLNIYEHEIPVKTEVCNLCNNNCRITVAEVQNEKVAYGFLCGRDYDTKKFVDKNTSGFDLFGERKKILSVAGTKKYRENIIIGLPASLHLFDEISLWEEFFRKLGIRTISSKNLAGSLQTGKRLAGAEFCSPIYAIHGHVAWLSEKVDQIFLPAYIESRNKRNGQEANYCYYTQFSPSVVSLINEEVRGKCMVPLINHSKGDEHVGHTLFDLLKPLISSLKLQEVQKAYVEAKGSHEIRRNELKKLYLDNTPDDDDIAVVLLGRPYLVMDTSLNKGIPEFFMGMGVKTFFQDMIQYGEREILDFEYLAKAFPWHFATTVINVAGIIARTKNVYPVFITGFKCAPDSFVIDYFKKLLDTYKKPYLLLQIDEHDSNVGYETRIEAGIRAFRNHQQEVSKLDYNASGFKLQASSLLSDKEQLNASIASPVHKLIKEKIVLFPNWDDISGRFIVANLRRFGYDARLLEQDDLGIRKSMAHNTGQCLPLNIIAQSYIDYIKKYDLDPSNTVLWLAESYLTCNIRMYPQYISNILENFGNGFEKGSVYTGEISHHEISYRTTYYAFFAYMVGGLLRRLGCHIRPYELNDGETDRAMNKGIEIIENSFLGNGKLEHAIKEAIDIFEKIPVQRKRRPQVAIFGDLFVRDNDVINQGLFDIIEKSGGEVINTPYHDYVKLTANNVFRRRNAKGEHLEVIGLKAMLSGMKFIEKRYYKYFEPLLGKMTEINSKKYEEYLGQFNISLFHSGESYDNILKIFHIIDKYPDTSLFVQTNPAFCCPSLITEAMTKEITRVTGRPIVTITYDGTSERKNDVVIPYLKEFG